jgi:Lon protease-like protein
VPVFPLPGVVLFPHTLLPLHIFELRYRTMVRDALSAERMIALALLKPGWEGEYQGSPDFFPVGCLARFEEVEWLPNDCYNLRVLGLSRVRIERRVREYPYRSARVRVLPQEPYTEDDPLVQIERHATGEVFQRLLAAAAALAGEQPPAAPGGDLPYEALVNLMCMSLEAEGPEKLALLELDSVIERGRRVREQVERRLRARVVRQPGDEQQN